ncbi:hypothetical protein [Parafrankia soli]|nr:hypothetical protein [Parafrankia soli]
MPRLRRAGPRATNRSPAAAATVMVFSLLTLTYARLHAWETQAREKDRDGGYSTETVIVTALLVVLALAVIGIIGRALIDKANSIDL